MTQSHIQTQHIKRTRDCIGICVCVRVFVRDPQNVCFVYLEQVRATQDEGVVRGGKRAKDIEGRWRMRWRGRGAILVEKDSIFSIGTYIYR